MTEEIKRKIIQIALASVFLVLAIVFQNNTKCDDWVYLLVFLVPYLIVGFDVLKEAIEKLVHRELFEEDFLMSLATMVAMFIGFLPNQEPMFHEAVFVMLFFKIGELFEEIAEGKSEKSINELIKQRPDYANLLNGEKITKVNPEKVKVGDTIEVYPGEKVPLDGVIIRGDTSVNTSALTGESVPRDIKEGEQISSGFINISNNIRVRVTKAYDESSYSKIINLVKEATERKSSSEKFITKFARIYTPVVVVLAILISFIPPLVLGDFSGLFTEWLVRGLTFLIVSCPCALVISVPLAFFGGIGSLSKHGILAKGATYLENACKVKNIVFDKTGTLTKGNFEVSVIHPEKITENELLHLSAHVERYSKHPIALSLKEAYKDEDDDCKVEVVEDISGFGIIANVNNKKIAVGNTKLMDKLGVSWKACEHVGTIVHVAIDDEYAGHIVILDQVKEEAITSISLLKKSGYNLFMLTGDHKEVAEDLSNKLQLNNYYCDLLPEDKVTKLEEIKKEGKTIFVGDGINDAPVIASADIGVAMGALGQDAAIEVADVVIMDDSISKIKSFLDISKKAVSIAYQNIVIAIAVKMIVLILAFLGYAPMWLAIFADVGVTVIAVLNAMRTLRI